MFRTVGTQCRRLTFYSLAGASLLACGLALTAHAVVAGPPDRDPPPSRYAGDWTVTPLLAMSCTIDYGSMPLKGEFRLRRLTTAVNQPSRLTVTAHMDVEFFRVPVPGTRSATMDLAFDQTAETFSGGGEFSTDTARVSVTMIGTILVTTSGSMRMSAGFSGPDTFSADIAVRLTPRVRISDTWRTADCTEIDATHTATRVR